MKSVHTALNLRPHKHTGKILAHKHTSYRVLFLLMLVPIFAMALVDQMVQASDSIVVSAKIPAPMPSDPPVITSPTDSTTTGSQTTVISGTCPVVTPPVIIVLYDGDTVIGSAQCRPDGTFSIPVTLSPGVHTIVATIVTITDDTGPSSRPIKIIYTAPNRQSQGSETGDTYPTVSDPNFVTPVHIVTNDRYVLLGPDGNAVWHGSFAGGLPVYTVKVDWGDGSSSTHSVADEAKQAYSHHYDSIGTYKIIVQVTDANGDTSTLYSTVVTLALQQGTGFDSNFQGPPVWAFVQKYIWQIYIGTFSSLVFLWYLEHGRHILNTSKHVGKLRPRH